MRSIKKIAEIQSYLDDIAHNIEIGKVEHNQMQFLNRVYNILMGKSK